MTSTDKKTNQNDGNDRLSILEGRIEQQPHNWTEEVENIKDTMRSPRDGDPFMGDDGAEVQYRSMKWWYVL